MFKPHISFLISIVILLTLTVASMAQEIVKPSEVNPQNEVGQYVAAEYGFVIEIFFRNGKLVAEWQGLPWSTLENVGGRKYRASNGSVVIFRPSKTRADETEMYMERAKGNIIWVKEKLNPPAYYFAVTTPEIVGVSLVQLIANPEKFDGKYIRVIGFVSLEFEGHAIYLHSDDYKYGIAANAFWLTVPEEIMRNSKEYDRKYLIIEGMFNTKAHGHLGAYIASIEGIRRFEVWSEISGRR